MDKKRISLQELLQKQLFTNCYKRSFHGFTKMSLTWLDKNKTDPTTQRWKSSWNQCFMLAEQSGKAPVIETFLKRSLTWLNFHTSRYNQIFGYHSDLLPILEEGLPSLLAGQSALDLNIILESLGNAEIVDQLLGHPLDVSGKIRFSDEPFVSIDWVEDMLNPGEILSALMQIASHLELHSAEDLTLVKNTVLDLIFSIRDQNQSERFLVKNLPEIASCFPSLKDFLAALELEKLSLKKQPTRISNFQYSEFCREYGCPFPGSYKIDGPVSIFSLYQPFLPLIENPGQFIDALSESLDTLSPLAPLSMLQFSAAYLFDFRPKIKVVAVDLDGLLWDGVVSETLTDDLHKPISPKFRHIQRILKTLKNRGLLLILLTKNNSSDVSQLLTSNPHMILKPEDFVDIQANWQPKPENLKKSIHHLGLQLENIAFLDNSPHEQEQMQATHPEVYTPKLPAGPTQLSSTIGMLGRFLVGQLGEPTNDRGMKTALYKLRLSRSEDWKKAKNQGISREDWLRSLGQTADFISHTDPRFTIIEPRLSDLSMNTNGFNLTTRRLSAADFKTYRNDPENTKVLGMGITDQLGEDGIVTFMVLKKITDTRWGIYEYCHSCRARERGIELAFMNQVIKAIRPEGVKEIVGVYRPTPRNQGVQELFAQFGFRPLASNQTTHESHAAYWLLDLDVAHIEPPDWIKLKDNDG